jgi:hypothetical protein
LIRQAKDSPAVENDGSGLPGSVLGRIALALSRLASGPASSDDATQATAVKGDSHVRRHAKAPSVGAASARGVAALVVVLGLFCVLLPASAFAYNTRVPTAFSPITGTGTGAAFTEAPKDVAVDESSGRVFALVGSEVRIFNAEGGVPAGVASPYKITGLSGASSIEIDNSSTSPNHGALYVATSTTIKRFVLNGGTETYEAAGGLTGSPAFASIGDIAIDTHGNVFVAEGENSSNRAIVEFSPTGTELHRTVISYRITNIAVDAAGDVFVTQNEYNTGTSNYVHKLPVNAAGEIESGNDVRATPDAGVEGIYYGPITVDKGANQLYVAEPSRQVTQYNATTLVKSRNVFGPAFLTQRGRFTVNSGSERVYSADSQKIVVFGSEVPLPDININETKAAGTSATLNAAINPLGLPLEECVFEWGPTGSYGTAVPCEGTPLPADSNYHPVSLKVSGLIPQGHVYHFRIKVKNSNGPEVTEDNTFTTGNIFSTGSSSEVAGTSALVSGTVNPEGSPPTECIFEYGVNTGYGSSVPCSPAAALIPGDFAAHAVSGTLSGLQSNTLYHYRISGASSLGSFHGSDRTFTTLGPPIVEEEGALAGQSTATLLSYVNPRGFNTSYRFEYGPTSSYGSRAPLESDLFVGSGTSPAQGRANISSLSENTTYHYRVVATSSAGTVYGPDQTFMTERSNGSCPNAAVRAEQVSALYPEGTGYLPQCMALEMVSPVKKYNQYAKEGILSASGERARFFSIASLAETPRLGNIAENYVASRTPSGWVTSPVELSSSAAYGKIPCAYSVDMGHWNGWSAPFSAALSGITTAFEGGVSTPYTPISPELSVYRGQPQIAQNGTCESGSSDASHEFFGFKETDYIQGDPVGAGSKLNVYEAYLNEGTPRVELLTRDKNGTVYGGWCGSEVGGSVLVTGANADRNRRGAVSPDASRVYFSTRPGQAEGVACNTATNMLRIMKRTMTPEGPVISEPISSECTRVAPACSTANGDDEYVGASQEGDRLYFATTRQLANSDLDTTRDLYLYDASKPAGSRLVQVSAGDSTDPHPGEGAGLVRVVDFSGDGSRVYFIAEGQLTAKPNLQGQAAVAGKPNLYLWERDAKYPSGRTVFIGTVAEGKAVNGNAVPALGADVEDQSVGGDGHVFVFLTKASLLPADQDGGYVDAYRYDTDTGALQLVSRAAPGGSENGPYDVSMHRSVTGGEGPLLPNGAAELTAGRSVSEDGQTIVFGTKEALDPRDTDGIPTPYVWHAGQTAVIPGGVLNPAKNSISQSLAPAGNEAAFATAKPLVAQDGDGVEDIYALRAFGGFPPPPPPQPCQGEACQEPFSPQPSTPGAPTETYSGSGNVKQAKAHKHKKRHTKKHRRAKHRKAHKRAAGNEHGGHK